MNYSDRVNAMFVIVLHIVAFSEGRFPPVERTDTAEPAVNSISGNDTTGRKPRFSALWELSSMVRCTTGKHLLTAIYDYAWYGCYCGIGGEGEPVDGTDRCCMIHDHCYDVAFRTRECPVEPDVYFVLYGGHYRMSSCLTRDPMITCDPPQRYQWWHAYPVCAAAICMCDAAVSKCLGRNTFHPKYAFYHKRTCKHAPPVTIGPGTATPLDATTSHLPFESTGALEMENELPEEATLDGSEPADLVNFMSADGEDPALVERNEIDGQPRYSKARFRKKMAEFKQENWPDYFKRNP